ncbi:MAG: IS66 family transposase [Gammaproteobacteria bacterium]|nr:IS66 family transposase [Gammaproteobacteria bacterium]
MTEGKEDEAVELVRQLVAKNNALELRLAEMLRRTKKNEAVSRDQLLLALSELASESDAALETANTELRDASGVDQTKPPKKKNPRQARRRAPAPAELRRVDNPISVPAPERPCPVCGKERACIGHDVTEVIELIPAEVVVRLDQREKLACKDCEGELVRAPQGDKVVSGGKFGCNLVATLLVDKYRDGLPLHRQKRRFAQMGLPVAVSTLADQVTWATDLLRPLWRAASVVVLASSVMQLDGTALAVRDRNHPQRKKMGALWGYLGDETALYLYMPTGKKRGQRPGELGPEDMLSLRNGLTVADGSNLFDASFKRPELIECGCNMHARRYFKKALDAGDQRMALALAAFKKLYEIEEEIREKPPDEKLAVRQIESRIVYDKLVGWCEAHQPHEPPSTASSAAFRYLMNQKEPLRRFLDHGEVPMDNGAIERLHIRVALTRKNFLFAGSDAGAERAAIAYTILGSCALAKVAPIDYLADVLPKLASGIRLRDAPQLLPVPWKASCVCEPIC